MKILLLGIYRLVLCLPVAIISILMIIGSKEGDKRGDNFIKRVMFLEN